MKPASLSAPYLGPRPLRIDAASSGSASAKGFALAKSCLVSSGLLLTSRRSRALYPFLLVFGIEFPFVSAGRSHADDADRFLAQGDEHHNHNAANGFADATPALAVRGRTSALSKNDSWRSAKSKPCLSRFARRFGSSQRIHKNILYLQYGLLSTEDPRLFEPFLTSPVHHS
jgi:hypothetical protein